MNRMDQLEGILLIPIDVRVMQGVLSLMMMALLHVQLNDYNYIDRRRGREEGGGEHLPSPFILPPPIEESE